VFGLEVWWFFFKDSVILKHKSHLQKLKIHAFCVGPTKKNQSHLQTKHSKEAKLPTKLGTLALGFAPNNNELLKYVWESGGFCDCDR
jgi:hypothetical protein